MQHFAIEYAAVLRELNKLLGLTRSPAQPSLLTIFPDVIMLAQV